MQAVEQMMRDLSHCDVPVLIMGEAGIGKDAVALQIHKLSRRAEESFLRVGCPELAPGFFQPPQHAPGANGNGTATGTVFLDEVGQLHTSCQPELLHWLAGGNGNGHKPGPSPRVISSSRQGLEKEVRAGRFMEELYYQISGVGLRLPPLRHRKEDIPALTDFFLARYSVLLGSPKPVLSPRLQDLILSYTWPGNIRELENAMKKIVALGEEGTVVTEMASRVGAGTRGGAAERVSLKQAARAASRQAERELILKVLTRTQWNRKRAAQELQISYKALLYKLKQIRMDSAGT